MVRVRGASAEGTKVPLVAALTSESQMWGKLFSNARAVSDAFAPALANSIDAAVGVQRLENGDGADGLRGYGTSGFAPVFHPRV